MFNIINFMNISKKKLFVWIGIHVFVLILSFAIVEYQDSPGQFIGLPLYVIWFKFINFPYNAFVATETWSIFSIVGGATTFVLTLLALFYYVFGAYIISGSNAKSKKIIFVSVLFILWFVLNTYFEMRITIR